MQPDWLKVERVLDRRVAPEGGGAPEEGGAPEGGEHPRGEHAEGAYPPLRAGDACLVKWKGLGYEAATWEAGALLLSLPDAAARVTEYEVWNDRQRQLDTSRHRPRPQGTETPYEKYEEQPMGIMGGADQLPLHKYQVRVRVRVRVRLRVA